MRPPTEVDKVDAVDLVAPFRIPAGCDPLSQLCPLRPLYPRVSRLPLLR
jgi:hypothetical protein